MATAWEQSMIHCPSRSALLVGLLLLTGSISWSQDAKQEYDLTWKLPHDRAAAYEIFDGTKGTKKSEFWLLGCELDGRVAVTDYRDLPLRFIFRRWPAKLKVGTRWEVKEFAFAECPPGQGNPISPVQVVGSYTLRSVKKAKLEDLFKVAFKSRKEKSEAVEVAIIEGNFQLWKARWSDTKAIVEVISKQPSTSIGVTLAIRPSDSAILAGRTHLTGRWETYQGRFDFAQGEKTTESIELSLREPFVEVSKEGLEKRIQESIARGVAWLKTQQGKDGKASDHPAYPLGTTFGIGSTAMCMMALAHSGVPLDDPVIKKGFSYLASKKPNESYDAAMVILATEAKYLPLSVIEDVERFTEDAAREKVRKELTRADTDIVASATHTLLKTQEPGGLFCYTPGDTPNFSSLQYAVLALHSADRMGIEIPPSVWKRAMRAVETYAQPTGREVNLMIRHRGGTKTEQKVKAVGWPYADFAPATGTMTCAGVAVIAICESALLRTKALTDGELRRYDELLWGGWAWLQDRFSVRAGTPEGCSMEPAMLLYYLYGLERAAILWDVETVGGHDWFLEGASTLMALQEHDGRWTGPEGWPVVDTAWALLFLKRATVPVETPAKVASIDSSKKTIPEKKAPDRKQ